MGRGPVRQAVTGQDRGQEPERAEVECVCK